MIVMAQRCFRLPAAGFILLALLLAVAIMSPAEASIQRGEPIDDETAQLFADYPKSAALMSLIYSHSSFGRKSKDLILYATWFPDGDPRVAYQCFAGVKGGIETHRWVYDWAIQASHTAQLDEPQLESLKNSIKSLPEGAKSPPLADLLILSFREGEKWKTHTYDRKKLPDEVKNIDKITDCTVWYKNL
jgi:hypothetical protein